MVIVGTYVGIGALAHDYGFSLPWVMLATVLIWAAPAQVLLISALVLQSVRIVPLAKHPVDAALRDPTLLLKGAGLTLEHYWHFFATPLYARVLLTTLEISVIATAPPHTRRTNPQAMAKRSMIGIVFRRIE